jgi:hypothetical protein
MYKIPLNIGTLAGMVSFGLFLGMYYLGLSPLSVGKFIGFWVPIAAIIWANLQVREKVLAGTMTYFQAFLTGSLTVLVWCTFKGFCMYIFMTAFNQHVIDQYFEFTESYIRYAEQLTGDNIGDQIDLDELKKGVNPWNLMMADISNNTIFGSFISFIVAFITKRAPKGPSL